MLCEYYQVWVEDIHEEDPWHVMGQELAPGLGKLLFPAINHPGLASYWKT